LFLAVRHPELVRTLTLAEPALIPWLADLSPPLTEKGEVVFADYNERLVKEARNKFAKSDTEGALRITLDYLSGKGMYDKHTEHHDLWMRNAKELQAIFTSKAGLSAPSSEEVRGLKMPTLLLSGEKSADSCRLAVAELETLLSTKRKEIPDATHAMWIDKPQECRGLLLDFLRGK
jgi:pimeloyl-ACP methyl ester carboxylesterase